MSQINSSNISQGLPKIANNKNFNRYQIFSLMIAVLVFFVLCFVYLAEITGINTFNIIKEKIQTGINWWDVAVGLTIYLKTSIDFALLIGMFMNKYPGFKNRVAIEVGTALGNALGTMIVLAIWSFFKDIKWLLAGMVILASLILFEMAQSSIEHVHEAEKDLEDGVEVLPWQKKSVELLTKILSPILLVISPILSKVMPNVGFNSNQKINSFWGLLGASFTVPFILGLDDFAGYVPLFNVVNVFGFGIGVFLSHCVLNLFLFWNPDFTIKAIKNPTISILGCLAFIGLGLYGLYEGSHLLLGWLGSHH